MNAAATWSSAATIRAQVQRLWDDGRLLAARVRGESLFPLELRLRQPTVAQTGERFDEVRAWIKELDAGSKTARGYGYQIVWREINHRQLGRNRIPDSVVFESDTDALRLIGRQAEARRFDQITAATVGAFPQLADWLARRALVVLEQSEAWARILAILEWFAAHPRPGLYLRQLDIEGVDSKFIETRKALLTELLDLVLPAGAIDPKATGARQFEARYGLLSKPALLRFRVLDPAHAIGGLSDLAVPLAQFAALQTNARRVFITENEINGLAFPALPDAMVIFGGGYGVERLADVPWLVTREVVYWGDIDTHGFAILDRLRAAIPHARSILMDSATLMAHRALWGTEDRDKRFGGQPSRLERDELALFEALRDDVFGERIRMEQERLSYAWVEHALATLTASPG
ncbi:DUF3322 domain-containing protein [Massilia antarctica]|uniref:DUF3322 domain-containing protein n=1 Tax=Massilia antarctica TaxID=2765360 RepID=UPI0006BB8CC6|nr:DUF3322 domain-containing protein [Massilia sp. H27-R4]MCY0916402.1 DUF3322 domain-containing protein [Massilia sp. H27-R4]CUI07216.1 FIG005429: hypothetical protein [Janthinobacterium sp. CG23_2]CUU31002.1 FIG005429: hypothetical protein [Janthinobacterium sp. CG23_2]